METEIMSVSEKDLLEMRDGEGFTDEERQAAEWELELRANQ